MGNTYDKILAFAKTKNYKKILAFFMLTFFLYGSIMFMLFSFDVTGNRQQFYIFIAVIHMAFYSWVNIYFMGEK